jgi:hypothetical protein
LAGVGAPCRRHPRADLFFRRQHPRADLLSGGADHQEYCCLFPHANDCLPPQEHRLQTIPSGVTAGQACQSWNTLSCRKVARARRHPVYAPSSWAVQSLRPCRMTNAPRVASLDQIASAEDNLLQCANESPPPLPRPRKHSIARTCRVQRHIEHGCGTHYTVLVCRAFFSAGLSVTLAQSGPRGPSPQHVRSHV